MTRKKGRPTGSAPSIRRAIDGTIISQLKMDNKYYAVGSIFFLYILVIVLAFVDSSVLIVISSPLFFAAFIFGGTVYLVGQMLIEGFESLIEKTSIADIEQFHIIGDQSLIKKMRKEADSEIRSRSEKTIYVGTFLFILMFVLILLSLFWIGFVSSGEYTLFRALAEVSICVYWAFTTTAFVSSWRLMRILNGYTTSFFDEDNQNLLLEYQQWCFERYISRNSADIDDSDIEKVDLDYGLSHYSFFNIAKSLIRRTRGLLIIFLSFLVETLVIVWLLSIQLQSTQPEIIISAPLSLMIVLVFMTLLIILMYSVVDYFDTEWALHVILDKSKRNLIALYDGAMQRYGIHFLSDQEKKSEKKSDIDDIAKKIELSEKMMKHSKQLPTWTFDAKVAGGITLSFIIQIIILVWNIINNISIP